MVSTALQRTLGALLLSTLIPPSYASVSYATKINFAVEDILEGDDGMPPHPLQPHQYGKPVYPTTVDGNGLEMVESHLSYWEGKYRMYSATWGCGGTIVVYAATSGLFGDYPTSPIYPPGDYGEDGNCGIKSFSSDDLTNWKLDDFYQPSVSVANVTKPLVRYSEETNKYVLMMGGGGLVALYYATSDSPSGPWSDPPEIISGAHVSHDFDVMVAPNGTHYMVTDTIDTFPSGSPESTDGITWDIWVHQLTPNLTSTVGTPETSRLIRSKEQLQAQGLTLEATSAFYHAGYYYMLFGMTCQNCAGYIYAYYSTHPLGPYKDLGLLSLDGCGGQNKGASVLPTSDGGQVVVNSILGYRTGPTNYVNTHTLVSRGIVPVNNYIWHGDNHQAASSTYWFPLEFNEDHTIQNITCKPEVKVPLVSQKESPERPVPYQLDCRIRDWRSIEATYEIPKASSKLEFPVWQRTDNLGPTTNAGPVLNGRLNVTLTYDNDLVETFSWAPSNISWAPAKISLHVGNKNISRIVLSTNATNGCFGTLVQPKADQGCTYGSVIPGLRAQKIQENSELFVHSW